MKVKLAIWKSQEQGKSSTLPLCKKESSTFPLCKKESIFFLLPNFSVLQNFSFFLAFPSLYSPTHYLNFLVEIGNKKNFTSECRQVRKRTEMADKAKFG